MQIHLLMAKSKLKALFFGNSGIDPDAHKGAGLSTIIAMGFVVC